MGQFLLLELYASDIGFLLLLSIFTENWITGAGSGYKSGWLYVGGGCAIVVGVLLFAESCYCYVKKQQVGRTESGES